jgi:hypothetical protein
VTATEPWEAARDAFWEAERGGAARTGDGWDRALVQEGRRGWEAAVRAGVDARVAAMVKAPDGGAFVVAFRDEVSAEEAEDLHERWAEYGPDSVSLVIVDDVAAIGVREPGDLAPGEGELAAARLLTAHAHEAIAAAIGRAEAAEEAKRAAKGELAALGDRLAKVIAAAVEAEKARAEAAEAEVARLTALLADRGRANGTEVSRD